METDHLDLQTPPEVNDVFIEPLTIINNERLTPSVVEERSAIWPAAFTEDLSDTSWPQFDQDDDSIRSWTLKEKKLLLRVITWNLCAKPPPPVDIFRRELLIQRFHCVLHLQFS